MNLKEVARKALATLVVSMLCLAAYAQHAVSGVVSDEFGDPMIGVNVAIKGTTSGAMTDIDGKFTLPSVKSSDVLMFTYIGCIQQDIKVGDQKTINVTMKEDQQNLEEVVVIGYGTVAKKDLTGAVASIKAKDVAAVPVSSATEAMTGKLAGVNITTTEGSPDADVKIRVRGGGSLSQDNSPLYIVDGFEASSISDIAPSEIESIDVLKDASSTAIYGARGANGVIIVTTKSGKEGKVAVDFGASFGMKKVSRVIPVLGPYDYAYYQYELGSTDYGNYGDLEIWRSFEGNDFQDQLFGRTGNQQQYNVNVSGGTKETKFNISYARNQEKSIMLGSGYAKDNVNAKINTDLNKWFSLEFQARLAYTNVDGLSGGADTNESNAANSAVAQAARFRPIVPIASSDDDEENSVSTQRSPYERIVATYKTRNSLNQTYNAGLTWKPFQGWTVRSQFSYGWKYNNTDQIWQADAVQNSKYGFNGQPQTVYDREVIKTWSNSNTITYDNKKLFGKRDQLNVLLGEEVKSTSQKDHQNVSVAFPSSMSIAEVKANLGAGTPYANTSNLLADVNMLSFFGRAQYTLAKKYLFNFTMRADGSSKFADGNRWGVFPSGSFAWRLSDEKWMSKYEDWLDNLKARVSFGTAGNNRISSGLMYTTYSMASATSKAPYFNNVRTSMLELGSTLSNPNLKWETTITRNFGIDYGFFRNRINGSVDLYWNTTKDLLMKTEIPSNTGYSFQYQNFGKTSNKGIEFTLNAVAVDTKKATINVTANLSWNKSHIDELNTGTEWQSSSWAGSTIAKYEDFRVVEGGQLGEVWGYKTNGFFTVYDPQNNPNGELVLKGTTWQLRDGIKDDSKSITGGSYYPGGLKLQCDEEGNPIKQKLGNTVAPVTGGFGVNGNVGKFDFNVFFNYSLGNQIINGSKLALAFNAGSAKNYNINDDFKVSDRYSWIDPATGLNLGKLAASTVTEYGGADAIAARLNEINRGASIYNPCAVSTMQLTDYAVEDASFLRLQQVTVGYSLPKNIVKKVLLSNVRFYVTGYNIFCLTSYTGNDPEVDTSSKRNAMCPGVDYASYPKSRTFVAGVNVSF